MRYFLLLLLVTDAFFLVNVSAFAQTTAQSQPSIFFCVGTNLQPPCVTAIPSKDVSSSPSPAVTMTVSSTPQQFPVISPTPNPSRLLPFPTPCGATKQSVSSTKKSNPEQSQLKIHTSGHQGLLKQFIELIILLLQLILKHLGIHLPGSGTGNPCLTPTTSIAPSSGAPSLTPADNINPTPVPSTNGPSMSEPSFIPTPTLFGVSPFPAQGGLTGFFAPSFSGKTFCTFSHQVNSISGNVLTVFYPKGSSAQSAGAPYGGTQICIPYAKNTGTDATLSYWLRIPKGFQFVKGGKLPGIYGGVEPFSGGGHNANGWSMRLMWRTNGAGEVYGYISTSSGYGDDWGRGNFTWLADGQWHNVIEHVHLNTPGKSNGWVTLTYNGKQVIDQIDLAITKTNTKITGLFFSTFYGGHDSSWAPRANEHIDFMNFSGTIQ